MEASENAIVFPCQGEQLLGILHHAKQQNDMGVLMVVGGPQYRVGSHRQFVILARFLAAKGLPVFRFDYRGMGDSSGPMQDFEQAGVDIKAAVDAFIEQRPEIKHVVLWGLCDAASAIGFYAPTDPRVKGLVLLNPWVRTEQGESQAFLKDYYLKRFLSRGFWQKIFSGGVDFKGSLIALCAKIKGSVNKLVAEDDVTSMPLPKRVLKGFSAFNKPMLFILSGKDLTAKEFINLISSDAEGQHLMHRKDVNRVDLVDCDHTFSRREWRDQVNDATLTWIKSL